MTHFFHSIETFLAAWRWWHIASAVAFAVPSAVLVWRWALKPSYRGLRWVVEALKPLPDGVSPDAKKRSRERLFTGQWGGTLEWDKFPDVGGPFYLIGSEDGKIRKMAEEAKPGEVVLVDNWRGRTLFPDSVAYHGPGVARPKPKPKPRPKTATEVLVEQANGLGLCPACGKLGVRYSVPHRRYKCGACGAQ